MMSVEIPTETTMEEVLPALEHARAEHLRLVKENAELKQSFLNVKVREKQLQDHADFLDKKQQRLEDWDRQVSERETQMNNQPKHYHMVADMGALGALMGHSNGDL